MGNIIIVGYQADGTLSSTAYSPPQGFKWRIMLAASQLTTGTGSSSRSVTLSLQYGYNALTQSIGDNILVISTSTTSTTIKNNLAPYVGTNSPADQNYPDFEIGPADSLNFSFNGIVTGDTVEVYLEIDELPDV